jgi:hypothetical protein
MSTQSQWYVNRDGQQLGPINSKDLKQMAERGELQPHHLVWKEGMPEWTQAQKIKRLFPDVPPAATGGTVTTGTATHGYQPIATPHVVADSPFVPAQSPTIIPANYDQDQYIAPAFHSRPRRSKSSDSWIYDFLTFRRLVTPIILKICFYFCVVVGTIAIIYSTISSNVYLVLLSPIVIAFYILFIRVYFEICLSLFMIVELLTDIKNNTKGLQE